METLKKFVISLFITNSRLTKKNTYLGRTQELTKKRCIDLIIKTDTPFETLKNLEFKAFCSYFAQCDVSLPSIYIYIYIYYSMVS